MDNVCNFLVIILIMVVIIEIMVGLIAKMVVTPMMIILRFGNYTCAMWLKLTEAATCVRSLKE